MRVKVIAAAAVFIVGVIMLVLVWHGQRPRERTVTVPGLAADPASPEAALFSFSPEGFVVPREVGASALESSIRGALLSSTADESQGLTTEDRRELSRQSATALSLLLTGDAVGYFGWIDREGFAGLPSTVDPAQIQQGWDAGQNALANAPVGLGAEQVRFRWRFRAGDEIPTAPHMGAVVTSARHARVEGLDRPERAGLDVVEALLPAMVADMEGDRHPATVGVLLARDPEEARWVLYGVSVYYAATVDAGILLPGP